MTVWFTPELVLATKLVSPAYSAVMLVILTASEVMAKVAIPLPFKALVPMMTPALLKVTVPPAVPAPGAVAATVAVKVTDCPKSEGFTEDVNAVVVGAATVAAAS